MAKTPKKPTPPSPSDFELRILGVLWRRGASTARDVLESLSDKERAYTSVLSVMQVMQKKGVLDVTDRRGRANVYAPTVSRRQVLGPVFRTLIQGVFGGSTSAAVEQLLGATAVDDAELDEIRKLIRQSKPAGRGKGKSE